MCMMKRVCMVEEVARRFDALFFNNAVFIEIQINSLVVLLLITYYLLLTNH
jgi:hypothetical protein